MTTTESAVRQRLRSWLHRLFDIESDADYFSRTGESYRVTSEGRTIANTKHPDFLAAIKRMQGSIEGRK